MGPGSVCNNSCCNRCLGVPRQLTAVADASAIKGSGVPIIADGGIRLPVIF